MLFIFKEMESSNEYKWTKPGASHFAPEPTNNSNKPSNHPHQTAMTLKCLYTNLDGLSNKVAELRELTNKEQPDLIFLTETKTDEEMLDNILYDTDSMWSPGRTERVNEPQEEESQSLQRGPW